MSNYRNAPIKNSLPKSNKSWEEIEYEKGFKVGINGWSMSSLHADFRPGNSPVMQGLRAGEKERRLTKLLLKSKY